jgi:membrane associated rhomboid family serine protease
MDPGTGDSAVVVRVTDAIQPAGDWALVLHSAGIDHRVDIRDGALALIVTADDAPLALAALDAFDAESRPVIEVPVPDLGPSPLGFACAALLVIMFRLTGAGDARPPSAWFDVGRAASTAILDGETWRTVTALTLHGDLMHLVGNVVASLLFVSPVGRWLGVGLGGALVLTSAAIANFLAASTYGPGHVSIGASTATFAALGLLAGMQIVRRFGHGERRRRAWIPLVAGLCLVIMLGASERADIVAHLFGLAVGVVAGVGVAASGVRAPGRVVQGLLATMTLGVLIGCWWIARVS